MLTGTSRSLCRNRRWWRFKIKLGEEVCWKHMECYLSVLVSTEGGVEYCGGKKQSIGACMTYTVNNETE